MPDAPALRSGRPRRHGVEVVVLDAAARLIADRGYRAATLAAIATAAGVAKTTLYRRWSSKAELAVDVLIAALGPFPAVEGAGAGTGSTDVGAELGASVHWLADRVGDAAVRELLLGLIGEAGRHDDLRALLRERVRAPYVAGLAAATAAPVERVDLAFDVVVGSLLHRAAMSGDLDAAALDRVTAIALDLLREG